MTTLVDKVIKKVKALSADEQKVWAEEALEDLEGDEIWERLFAETTDEQWDKMIAGVKEEVRAGKTSPLTAGDFLTD